MKIHKPLMNAGFSQVELVIALVVVVAFAVVGIRVLTVSHADSVSGTSAVVSTSDSKYQTVVLASTSGTVTACRTATQVLYRSVVAVPSAYVQVGLDNVAKPTVTTNVATILRSQGTHYNTTAIGGKSLTNYIFWSAMSDQNIAADKTYKGGGVLLSQINQC